MASEQCTYCGAKHQTPWEFIPGMGHICQTCSMKPNPALDFQRHLGKCWTGATNVEGEVDIKLLSGSCYKCRDYSDELGPGPGELILDG